MVMTQNPVMNIRATMIKKVKGNVVVKANAAVKANVVVKHVDLI
jgi:hypothetical protein